MTHRKEQLSQSQLRKLIMGMFLFGIPFAVMGLYTIIEGEGGTGLVLVGFSVWLLWLLRLVQPSLPRSLRIVIWSVSTFWHALITPICIMGMIVWFGWYFAAHSFVMLGLSLLLLTQDRPSTKQPGEQVVALNR